MVLFDDYTVKPKQSYKRQLNPGTTDGVDLLLGLTPVIPSYPTSESRSSTMTSSLPFQSDKSALPAFD